jgi:hypothetical protein
LSRTQDTPLSVFFAHSFAETDRGIVRSLKRSLQRRGYRVLSGEKSEARRVSMKVRRRIASADVFVALLTRRHRIPGESASWTSVPWVIEEKGFSLGQKATRPIILLVEEGITVPSETGGLEGDLEFIRFHRERLDEARQKLGAMMSAAKAEVR